MMAKVDVEELISLLRAHKALDLEGPSLVPIDLVKLLNTIDANHADIIEALANSALESHRESLLVGLDQKQAESRALVQTLRLAAGLVRRAETAAYDVTYEYALGPAFRPVLVKSNPKPEDPDPQAA